MEHFTKDFLVQSIKARGDACFCTCQGEEKDTVYTYADLMRDVCKCMTLYDDIPAEGNLGLWAETGYEVIVASLAAFLKGRLIAVADSSLSWEDAAALMKKTDVSTVIYGKAAAVNEAFLKDESFAKISAGGYADCEPASEKNFPDVEMKAPAIILFTSGTTGAGKGVVLSFYSLYMQKYLGDVRTRDRMLSILPCYHIYFFVQLIYIIYSGSSVVLSKGVAYITEEMQKYKPTFLCVVPILLVNLFEAAKRVADGNMQKVPLVIKKMTGGELNAITTGGAGIDKSIFKYFNEAGIVVADGYGMTEFGGAVATNMSRQDCSDSVGILSPFLECKIVDGEVLLKSDVLFYGYYNDPEATDAVLKDGWFLTGDLGYIKDNRIYITGRKKNLIILANGENVSPEELERLIENGPDIDEVLVREDQNVICAEIYSKLYGTIENSELINRINAYINELNAKLPSYKKIAKTKIRKEPLAKSNIGKILRGVDYPPNVYLEKDYVAPTNEIEAMICKMAEEILEVERVGIDDDFLEMGVHSISFVRFNKALEDAGYKIDIPKMFENTTPRKLALLLSASQKA